MEKKIITGSADYFNEIENDGKDSLPSELVQELIERSQKVFNNYKQQINEHKIKKVIKRSGKQITGDPES